MSIIDTVRHSGAYVEGEDLSSFASRMLDVFWNYYHKGGFHLQYWYSNSEFNNILEKSGVLDATSPLKRNPSLAFTLLETMGVIELVTNEVYGSTAKGHEYNRIKVVRYEPVYTLGVVKLNKKFTKIGGGELGLGFNTGPDAEFKNGTGLGIELQLEHMQCWFGTPASVVKARIRTVDHEARVALERKHRSERELEKSKKEPV
jgi:hypothetical protein